MARTCRVRILTPGLALIVIFATGCTSSAVGERDLAFVDYYPLMTDEQRVDFGSLRRVQDRHDFVRAHGLDIALNLEESLREGMDPTQVREVLGEPHSVEGHSTPYGDRAGRHLTWFYRGQGGARGPLTYVVRYLNDEVEGWAVLPPG